MTTNDRTETLDAVPNLAALYARAAVASVLPGGGDALPDRTVAVTTTIDRDDLVAYQRLCGFRVDDAVPATYPFVLTFPLAVHLMAVPEFPFPLPGLVHLHNVIRQDRPLVAGEPVTLSASVADLRDHPKGRVFDLVLRVHVDGEVVWEDVATNLARGREHPDADAPTVDVADDLPRRAVWTFADDTGRRYAAVSGDRNPIHLTALTARPFGFPRPIAHGMYTAARVLAALESRRPADGLEYTTSFRSPVLLPTRLGLHVAGTDDRWDAAVRSRDGDRTHLLATVRRA